MASTSGTSSSYLNLLTALRTFLTTDATLVSLSENWTQLKDTSSEVDHPTETTPERHLYMQGPGLSGTDQVHVNIRAYRDPSNLTYFNWELRGAVGFSASDAFNDQPGVSPRETTGGLGGPRLTLIDGNMNYWFFANGRRFIVVVDVNGTWSTMYGGFYLPYATPSELQYPFYVGGNSAIETQVPTTGDSSLSSFWDPVGELDVPGINSAYLRDFGGSWRAVSNFTASNGNVRQDTNIWPFNFLRADDANNDISIQSPGNISVPLPCVIHSTLGGGNVYGELDGVFWVSGSGRSPTDTLTIGGDTYLIVRSAHRQNPTYDYVAIKLG